MVNTETLDSIQFFITGCLLLVFCILQRQIAEFKVFSNPRIIHGLPDFESKYLHQKCV